MRIQLQPLPPYNNLLVVLINIIGIILAFVVYKHNSRAAINRIFLLMSFLMLVWVDFAYLARLIGKSHLSLAEIFLRVAWFATPLFFSFLYLLVAYLIGKQKEYRVLSTFIISISFIIAIVTGFSNLVIEGISFFRGIDLRIDYGKGMFPFLGVILFFICASLYPLIKTYFESSGQLRKRIEYFLLGIFVFYLANFIFNITLPVFFDIVRFYWIGDYSTIFLLGFISYSIIKQELFGIKVVLTQGLVVVIATLLLWQAVVAVPNWFDFSWRLSLFLLFLIFGYFLVQSVIREIKQREQIEGMAKELQRAYVVEKRAKEELEKLDKLKDQFMTQTQHDLRTPLTSIMGYADLLIKGTFGKQTKKTAEVVKKIQGLTEGMVRKANNFLALAQFQLGKSAIDLKPGIQLFSILEEIKNELDFKAQSKGIYLNLEKPEREFLIKADREKLKAAIFNIVDNSVKYTQDGGVTIKINTKSQITNSKQIQKQPSGVPAGPAKFKIQNSPQLVLIAIQDTGIGIAPDKIKTVFDTIFERTEQAKKTASGAGIGLYLSTQIIKDHGGRVWAESEGEGKGSTFYVELPITKDADSMSVTK